MLYHSFRWGSATLWLASLQLVPQFHNFAHVTGPLVLTS